MTDSRQSTGLSKRIGCGLGSQNLLLMQQVSETLSNGMSEPSASAKPRVRMAAGIEQLRADLGERVRLGYVVHPGTVELPLGRHAMALPFARFWR